MNTNKPILDATCGGRMMWFDKHNPHVLYVDRRELTETTLCDGRRFEVKPDMLADFRHLPFADKSFMHVVFDPPHLIHVNDDAYMAIKYGRLHDDWQQVLHDGFWECMRVLDDYGTLIFKWSEVQIYKADVLTAIGYEPMYGDRNRRAKGTHWMAFMKFPEVDADAH